ncbi:hypothetical protein B0F90DRAFT_925908 [Multifurca ochricompacta]|uniref:Uncharacterized protein n=1 Tax=Multifurca ochricompacta TaxID=376703 RepID=A0AAD4M8J2_9AGAM|nr:hypothetical protein B0F90DRAFT_925908 [Multifurca ochricompacta]
MVALSHRFTFLAALCAIAALSSAPISDAAALRLPTSDPALMLFSAREHTLPAPDAAGAPQKDDTGPLYKKGEEKDEGHLWNPFYPVKKLSELWSGDRKLGDNHVYYARAPHHHHNHHHHHHHDRRNRGRKTRRRVPEHDRNDSENNDHVVLPRAPHHHHGSHKKVIVSGDHDRVRVGRSPHHHHHHGYEKVIVSGDDDHVRVTRSPHHHHHHHHHENEKVIVSGDNDNVHVHRSVLISGEGGESYVVPHVVKRDNPQELLTLPSLGRRSGGINGVPGHVDIVSPSADSGEGRRIASLVLVPSDSLASETSTSSSPAFVLNASETDVTQIFLVPTPTSPSSSTSNSTFGPNEMGVMLRLEMFDPSSASIASYCATFDPDPPAPAPLTAEECTSDPVAEHRSQLFAFNGVTGLVRPMWFKGQDDGTDSGNGGCDGGVDPPTPQSASLASVTDVDSGSTPSTDQAQTNNSTVPAADPSQGTPSNSSEGSISGAQRVALVFVAAEPVIPERPAVGSTTTSSVLATASGAEVSGGVFSTPGSSAIAMASSTPGSLAAASPTALASVSSSSPAPASASASIDDSAGSDVAVSTPVSSGTLTSVPPSVSGSTSTSSAVLGVQVVSEAEGDTASTTSASVIPTMTPVNTRPYEWMFKPDSR